MFLKLNAPARDVATYLYQDSYGQSGYLVRRDFGKLTRYTEILDADHELAKLLHGDYQLPGEIFMHLGDHILKQYVPHYARKTSQDRGIVMIRTSPDGNRYQGVKIGRFLGRHTNLGQQAIKDLSELFKAQNPNVDLSQVKTSTDITDVYRRTGNLNSSEVEYPAQSCMGLELGQIGGNYQWSDYFDPDAMHPMDILEDSGLQIAYLEDDEGIITARAIYSEVNQGYVRIYGKGREYETLMAWFEQNGYERNDRALDGHQLKKINLGSGKFLMPYIDGHGNVEINGDHLVIEYHGSFNAQGSIYQVGVYRIGDYVECENCSVEFDLDDPHSDQIITDDGSHFCDSDCAEEAGYRLAYVSIFDQEWISENRHEIYEYQGDYYTDYALQSHSLFICDECGEVESLDDAIIDGNELYYCSEHCAESAGNVQVITDRRGSTEWLYDDGDFYEIDGRVFDTPETAYYFAKESL